MDIEQRKQSVLNQLGPEAANVLEEHGVDAEAAITRVLQKQQEKEEEIRPQLAEINSIMTSELVYLSNDIEDELGKEYTRRLSLIGFSEEQIKSLYQEESLIAASEGLSEQRKQPWVQRRYFTTASTLDNIPKIEEMTLSELNMITDDANSAITKDHHVLEGEAWQAVCTAACGRFYTEAKYAYAFKDRIEKLEWSEAQARAYTKNEMLLTERLKWQYHDRPAWTEESTDLKQF
jgi:hypothetical protein